MNAKNTPLKLAQKTFDISFNRLENYCDFYESRIESKEKKCFTNTKEAANKINSLSENDS